MNDRFTFIDLFKRELDINKDSKAKISQIVIPKIQRPYAQGRQDGVCTYVRENFLNEMFETFKTDDIFDLNFIYGIIRASNNEFIMELLDGQQRMTTLFLVHWYIANRELAEDSEEDKVIRESLGRFVYETRSTATVFCEKLSSYRVEMSDKPSKIIKRAKWYFKSFDRDSTICAMLIMLDAIHEKYNEQDAADLHKKLSNIQFYVKSLGYFNLSEELYIKMNARGLQLSPFENFKADLTNFISNFNYDPFRQQVKLYNGDENVDFYFNFSVKLDSKWVDLFWKKGTDNFDASYMNFFTRFFACKYIIATQDVVSDRDIRSDKILRKLYTDEDSLNENNEYVGFQDFEQILKQHPEFILTLDKTLDVFYEYDLKDNRKDIFEQMLPIWEKTSSNIGDDFYCNASTKMTHTKLIVFGAVIEFIDAYKEFEIDTFRQWMRVVWNVIENTNIDSLTPVSSLIRKFSAVIHNTAMRAEEFKSFYAAFAQLKDDSSNEREIRALVEEVSKAALISSDDKWKDIFIIAEQHPFFKGMVLFFYSDGMSLKTYSEAYNIIKDMFDENGISSAYKQDHILIRALISNYKSWGDLRELYVTERVETNKHLKNIIAANDSVKQMFAEIAVKAKCDEDAKRLLNEFIANANAEPFEVWINPGPMEEEYCNMAVNRIRYDARLYDWISNEEAKYKSVFRIYWYEGHIMFAIPKRQYAKVALDTERAKIAYKVSQELGFEYNDPNQCDMYEEFGDSFGNEIWLKKDLKQCTLWVGFCQHHKLSIQIECKTKKYAEKMLETFKDSEYVGDDERLVEVMCLNHFKCRKTYNDLSKALDYITEIITD